MNKINLKEIRKRKGYTQKELASKLGICDKMYQEAYKIYDFRRSGSRDYILSEEEIKEKKNWYDTPTENF